MKEQNNYFYDFESFRIDMAKRSLFYNGQDLQIKSKAFETLLFLVQRRGEIVTKSELLSAVWTDIFVEENNLTQQISALRRKFRECGEEDEFIITIPKQGYKFVSPVTEIKYGERQILPAKKSFFDNRERANIRQELKKNPSRSVIKFLFYTQMREITLGCLLMMMVVWFAFHVENQQSASKIPRSIAVLEFQPLDGNEKSSLYSAGITRTLTAKIGNLETMILRPAGASERFYGQERDVVAIGNKLQADIVLEGSVQNEGEIIRIAVVAWDSKANCQLWGDVFTGNSSDIFMMQDAVAKEIISAVQRKL